MQVNSCILLLKQNKDIKIPKAEDDGTVNNPIGALLIFLSDLFSSMTVLPIEAYSFHIWMK